MKKKSISPKSKIHKKILPLFKLNFDQKEVKAVTETVQSGWLTMGERVSEFEAGFDHYLGSGVTSTAVSSCTAALHLALLALNVGSGDEVIIPSLTFVADANVVELVGAKPVLADCSSLSNWNVSAETIAPRITPRTKAVIVMHYAGYPCDMAPILKLCKKRGIHVIEDTAHAPGASINGKKCGTLGDIGCFSFFSNKNLSIGEGGMIVTHHKEISQRLRYLRCNGMTTLMFDRHKGRASIYDVVEPGLNYRMDEIRGAIGTVQLKKLVAGNARREALTTLYRKIFKGTKITVPFGNLKKGMVPAFHLLPVLLPEGCDRAEVMNFLKDQGIQSSIHYAPLWSFSAYRGKFKPADAPVAENICERELTLPLFPGMTDKDVDLVTKTLLKVVG